uniref:Uncharacterized protein n=1 Tax=Arundo donax TaxID=35708 RepID=A0A0A9CP46_ARUDO
MEVLKGMFKILRLQSLCIRSYCIMQHVDSISDALQNIVFSTNSDLQNCK